MLKEKEDLIKKLIRDNTDQKVQIAELKEKLGQPQIPNKINLPVPPKV